MMIRNRVLTMTDEEQRILARSLNDLRNEQIRRAGPTEDVDDLLLRVIDAPKKGFLFRAAPKEEPPPRKKATGREER